MITCTIDMSFIIQGASSRSLHMIGGCMHINSYNKRHDFLSMFDYIKIIGI